MLGTIGLICHKVSKRGILMHTVFFTLSVCTYKNTCVLSFESGLIKPAKEEDLT